MSGELYLPEHRELPLRSGDALPPGPYAVSLIRGPHGWEQPFCIRSTVTGQAVASWIASREIADKLAAAFNAHWDEPELDATDYAHPAWWRGNDTGVAVVVAKLEDALNGRDDGTGVIGYEPLERLRRRLLDIIPGEG